MGLEGLEVPRADKTTQNSFPELTESLGSQISDLGRYYIPQSLNSTYQGLSITVNPRLFGFGAGDSLFVCRHLGSSHMLGSPLYVRSLL